MTSYAQVAERYLAIWNEADDARRRALMDETWSAQARYVDPMMTGEGRDGIAAMIAAARGQFPGLRFSLDGRLDGHGPHLRFSWRLAPDGGPTVARGTDFAALDAQGRLESVVGFLDQMPAAA